MSRRCGASSSSCGRCALRTSTRSGVFRGYFDEQLASGCGMAVVDRATGRAIGSSRYHGFGAERSEVEIGWTFLDSAYWGGTVNGMLLYELSGRTPALPRLPSPRSTP